MIQRVQRLVDAPASPGLLMRGCLMMAAVALAAGPWLIALAPTWAARNGLCLPGTG